MSQGIPFGNDAPLKRRRRLREHFFDLRDVGRTRRCPSNVTSRPCSQLNVFPSAVSFSLFPQRADDFLEIGYEVAPMNPLAKLLCYLGSFAFVLILGLRHSVLNGYPFYDPTRVFVSLSYASLVVICVYGAGLPDLPSSWRAALRSSVVGMGTAVLLMSTIQVFVGDLLLPRYVVFGSGVLLVPWLFLSWKLSSGATSRAQLRDTAVVIADNDEINGLLSDAKGSSHRPVRVAGVVDLEGYKHGGGSDSRYPSSQIAVSASEGNGRRGYLLPNGGSGDDALLSEDGPMICTSLTEAVMSLGASLVILGRRAQLDEEVIMEAAAVHESGVRVRTLARFYEEWLGKFPVSDLERLALFFDIKEVHSRGYRPVKRILDLATGLVGCLLLLVLTPVVALCNLVGNRGALFYRQNRVGKSDKPIRILKFRTMRETGREEESSWTLSSDERVTAFGRFLRAFHLDEIPQAINLLRGDLSIVGPRPEQPHYVQALTEMVPYYQLRHLVQPGLTGWAQVNYQYASSESEALEKLKYEFYYLRNQSLMLDLRIIGRTVRIVLQKQGR